MDLLSLCKDFVRIPSVSIPNGTDGLVAFLTPIFERLGLRVATQDLDISGHRNQNLRSLIGPEGGDAPLLINTHLDTVSPGDHRAWTRCNGDPFNATVAGEFLHGLGVADTKLALACQLIALENLLAKHRDRKPSAWRQPLVLLATAGEEIGLLGAKHAIATNFVSARVALDSEPTELQIVWAHKGLCAINLTFWPKAAAAVEAGDTFFEMNFAGEAAHSSTPLLGKNALDAAFFQIAALPPKTFSPVYLNGGSAPNIIPPAARLIFSAPEKADLPEGATRAPLPLAEKADLLPPQVFAAAAAFHRELKRLEEEMQQHTQEEFDPPFATTATTLAKTAGGKLVLHQDNRFIEAEGGREFFAHVKILGATIRRQFPEINIEVELEHLDERLYADAQSPFVKTARLVLQGLQLPARLVTKAGCTEGAVFAGAGIECIVFGPGSAKNNIHKPNERVALSDLTNAVRFYEAFIEKVCLGL